jgi:hypothetical protein
VGSADQVEQPCAVPERAAGCGVTGSERLSAAAAVEAEGAGVVSRVLVAVAALLAGHDGLDEGPLYRSEQPW